jgi:hypothetical protein
MSALLLRPAPALALLPGIPVRCLSMPAPHPHQVIPVSARRPVIPVPALSMPVLPPFPAIGVRQTTKGL